MEVQLRNQPLSPSGSVLESLAHLVIRPVGHLLRLIGPGAYAAVRWELGKRWPTRRWLGNPIGQHFLLPLLVRTGDTVLDIGANTGQFTIPLARLVGPEGVVHSFEPIAAAHKELLNSVENAGLSGSVRCLQLALGESTRMVEFTIPKDRPTEATAAPHSQGSWSDFRSRPEAYETQACSVIELDDYVRDNGIGEVSFVKCDVEGAEFLVMQGAKSLLERPQPPVLMMEIYEGWTKSFGYEPRDLIEFLEKTGGYECYWISPSGLRRVRLSDRAIPGIFYQWVDFLFIVQGLNADRAKLARYVCG